MRMKVLAAVASLAAVAGFAAVVLRPSARPTAPYAPSSAPGPVPALYDDASAFLSPMMQAKGEPSVAAVTGITVPHHLLARDLIAEAFRFASSSRPRQVLLLSPDHFFLGRTDVSVSDRDFSTVFGAVRADRAAAAALAALPSVSTGDFFAREHGLQAELPFIRRIFPDAEVIALTFKESTPAATLDAVVGALEKALDRDALVVQSTDFSHYLPAAQADARDAQTVAALEKGDPAAILALDQPANLDSTAAQYVQSRLQKEFFGSHLVILARRNSQAYADGPVASTTSYIVQAYVKGE